jgi:deoxycytidylate deaminase
MGEAAPSMQRDCEREAAVGPFVNAWRDDPGGHVSTHSHFTSDTPAETMVYVSPNADELPLADAEVVLGLVGPLGTPMDLVQQSIKTRLQKHGYRIEEIRLSEMLAAREKLEGSPSQVRDALMDAGSALRDREGSDVLAKLAIVTIRDRRGSSQHRPRTAFLVRSLKHPDEVHRLRATYGDGFFLIGVTASARARRINLTEDQNFDPEHADLLLRKDAAEDREFGQQTRKTFQLADAFVRCGAEEKSTRHQVYRLVDLLMSHPFLPPTREEYAMFLAYSASLRSADLSRQVGAVVVAEGRDDIIAMGANDVPAPRGRAYWPEAKPFSPSLDVDGGPDYVRGYDSNQRERNKIIAAVIRQITDEQGEDRDIVARHEPKLRGTGILDLTEYGRAVHAEMAALLSCARSGVSPLGGTLYCTTFPCHNCAKHIVAAGIVRVVYVEPYPKSRARDLHQDAIVLPDEEEVLKEDARVRFEAFEGVGPRRFLDIFSLTLGGGRHLRRKLDGENGDRVHWKFAEHSAPRLPLDVRSYLDREELAAEEYGRRLERDPNEGKGDDDD